MNTRSTVTAEITQLLRGREFAPDPRNFTIDQDNILDMLGMNRSQADSYLLGLMAELTSRSKQLAEPRGRYKVYPDPEFNRRENTMLLEGVRFDLGNWVTGFLQKSDYMALFVGTCGEKVEQHSKALLKDGQNLEGYLVDLIASEIAEEVAAYIHHQIGQDAANAGLNITNRYSPGYCHWNVSEQQKLFSILGENTCGIELTSSSLMMPIKSVSGIIGIGENVEQVGYKCRVCPDEKCIMREKFTT